MVLYSLLSFFTRIRFPDTMTRTAWQESLANAILQHKCAGGSLAVARRAWLSQAISGDSALKGRGLLATAVSEQALEDSPSSASSPSKSAIGGSLPSFGFAVGNDNNNNNSSSPSGGGRGATSHVQRLLQLRSDRAMGPITGGSVPPSPSSSPLQTHPQQQQQQRKNGPDLLALQNLHRGGGRKMS